MEHLFGQMVANIKENLKITILRVLAIIFGLMGVSIKVLGEIIKCMGEEYLFGQMAENMKENILMTKNKDLASLVGLMEDAIKDNGKTESKMEKGLTKIKRGFKRMVFGWMGKKLNGLIDIMKF